jgi:hypothetical protein
MRALDVANVVDTPIADGMVAFARDVERIRIGLRGSAVNRKIGMGDSY